MSPVSCRVLVKFSLVSVPVGISMYGIARQALSVIGGEVRGKLAYEMGGKLAGPAFGSVRFHTRGELTLPRELERAGALRAAGGRCGGWSKPLKCAGIEALPPAQSISTRTVPPSISVSKIVLFNKPLRRTQPRFTRRGKWRALDAFIPVGACRRRAARCRQRGLLILTDDGKLQARIADPKHKLEKTYWAQVEGASGRGGARPFAGRHRALRFHGATGQGARHRRTGRSLARDPPIRYRAAIPTAAWLEIRIREGKNRQVGG